MHRRAFRDYPKRLPGQRYSNNAETMEVGTGSFDAPTDRFWTFVGSLDNGATTTEMRFLARVQQQLPGEEGEVYRQSILKGVRYLGRRGQYGPPASRLRTAGFQPAMAPSLDCTAGFQPATGQAPSLGPCHAEDHRQADASVTRPADTGLFSM